MTRYSQLSDQKNVKWCVERLGNFKSDRYATSGQCEHKDVRAVGIGGQLARQKLSGLATVTEYHRYSSSLHIAT
jgi:hypothetical protein